MIRYGRRSIALAVGLSTLAGYVDSVGFLSVGNFFVSFMSGNSTRLGTALAEGRTPYVMLALGVIGLFVAGVVVGSLVAFQAKRKRKPVVLILVSLLLAIAAVSEGLHQGSVAVAFMILAMGAENTVFQREGEVSIGVTYMTGTLVKVGQRLAMALRGGPRWEWLPYLLLWLGLIAGVIAGAVIHSHIGASASLWIAVVFGAGLAAYAFRYIDPSQSHHE